MTHEQFTPEERAAVMKFHAALAQRCAETPEDKNCPACDMRLYCYTAPPGVTPNQLNLVMDFLGNRAADSELASSMDRAFRDAQNHHISPLPCEE